MKSKYLEEYIEYDGCGAEEQCIQLFVDLDCINNNINYDKIISIIMPKFIKFFNENKKNFMGVDTKKTFKLIDEKHQTYEMKSYSKPKLEPFEEGFLTNQDDLKNYINYIHKISNYDFENISTKENKFQYFPYIKEFSKIELGFVVIYKDNKFILIENVKNFKDLFNDKKKYICLSIIDFDDN